jgi:hypothetical protein
MGYAITRTLVKTLQQCFNYVLGIALILPWALPAEVINGKEAGTGRLTWEWREAGISFQLLQLLPDQTRAFYLGRGFSKEHAEIIANACVFQTIFRNEGKTPISYDLNDWSVLHQGRSNSLLTREHWNEKWLKEGASQAARIAMEWALLPTRQRFEPGDYNWGMSSYGFSPGSSFDLTLVIQRNNEAMTAEIPDILCAPDQTRP